MKVDFVQHSTKAKKKNIWETLPCLGHDLDTLCTESRLCTDGSHVVFWCSVEGFVRKHSGDCPIKVTILSLKFDFNLEKVHVGIVEKKAIPFRFLKGQCHEMDIFWRSKPFYQYFLCTRRWFPRSFKIFSLQCTIINFLFASLKLLTNIENADWNPPQNYLLCDWLMFSSADLSLAAGKMHKN